MIVSYNYNSWFIRLGLLETISIIYCENSYPDDASQEILFESIVKNTLCICKY